MVVGIVSGYSQRSRLVETVGLLKVLSSSSSPSVLPLTLIIVSPSYPSPSLQRMGYLTWVPPHPTLLSPAGLTALFATEARQGSVARGKGSNSRQQSHRVAAAVSGPT